MTRSAYAVRSALSVACPPPSKKGCGAAVGKPCQRLVTDSTNHIRPTLVQVECKRCHSARRKAADETRTQEVNQAAMTDASSLVVACPTCWAEVGTHCHVYTRGAKVKAARSHSSRRKAADVLRTQEVNPSLCRPSHIVKLDFGPIVEAASLAVSAIEKLETACGEILKTEKSRMETLMSKGLPNGASVTFETSPRFPADHNGHAKDFGVSLLAGGRGYNPQDEYCMLFTGPVDTHEIPPEIPVDPDRRAVQRIPDLCPDDSKDEPHNAETCRDPACDCYPF